MRTSAEASSVHVSMRIAEGSTHSLVMRCASNVHRWRSADSSSVAVMRPRRSDRQALEVHLSQLRDLGRDHCLAVGLPRVSRVVVLMIRLGGIELRQRLDGRYDRLVPCSTRLELLDGTLRFCPLVIVVRKDRRTILS